METIMVMEENDNVAVCLKEMEGGVTVQVPKHGVKTPVALIDDIPFAHKFALRDIDAGQEIVKFGEVIGLGLYFAPFYPVANPVHSGKGCQARHTFLIRRIFLCEPRDSAIHTNG